GSLVPVCPVELIKVDRGKPEPLQASSECLADCGWSTAARERCILGRDRQRPTTSAREGAKELLSFAPAIRLGGIEQVETCLQACLERTDHVLGAVVLAIAPVALVTPSPAADAEGNHPERTVAQLNGCSHWKPAHRTRRFAPGTIQAYAWILSTAAEKGRSNRRLNSSIGPTVHRVHGVSRFHASRQPCARRS